MHPNITPEINQKLAHIRSFLRRGELLPALDAFGVLLNLYNPALFASKPRFEIEDGIRNSLLELHKHAEVKDFLKEITRSDKGMLTYRTGGEETLGKLLAIIAKGLAAKKEAAEKEAEQQIADRREKLWSRGQELIKSGELIKGKAMLRKLADEFPEDMDLALQVADAFKDAKLYGEASELYQRVTEQAPKNSKGYGGLVNCLIELNEYEKAEEIYTLHVRQFGKHPRTLVNLASLYARWGKRAKAIETAYEALAVDPENADAKEIIAQNER